jgi:hypothetical protein
MKLHWRHSVVSRVAYARSRLNGMKEVRILMSALLFTVVGRAGV